MFDRIRFATAAWALGSLLACGGSGPVLPDDDDDNIRVNPRSDAGVSPDGNVVTGPDGSVVEDADGGGTGGDPDGSVEPEGVAPTLTGMNANQSGREGKDVRVELAGEDPDGDIAAFVLRFMDDTGADLMIMDTDLDGDADSSSIVASPDTSVLGDVQMAAVITFENLFERYPDIARIEAFALDERGLASDLQETQLILQTAAALGDPCDETYITTRCAEGLGCDPGTTTCVDGTSPNLTEFAYVTTPNGYRILVAGEDPDDDIWRVDLEFLDSGGAPVMLDLDNDGEPDSDHFEIDATGTSHGGEFYVALEPTQTFVDQVQQLAAVPYDSRQAGGNRLTARVTRPPSRRSGQACDPRGFDACSTTDVCYPGVLGVQNNCLPLTSQRQRTCQDAPILNPSLGITTAVGVADGASLWDAPAGCAALDPTNRPEGVVSLDLPNGARSVTLSTVGAGATGFDTVLYVIDGCALRSDPILGCHDNTPTSIGSELVLENVAAGRYLVVVDSWNAFGGAFELQVNVVE